MKNVTRGATVVFTVTFRDAGGSPVTGVAALGKLTYKKTGARVTADLTFVPNGSAFVATWDSAIADPGTVHWAARSDDGSPFGAVQGSFPLVANDANQAIA